MAKILIVEDDNVIADGMARHLVAAGYDPVVVGRGELGLARLRFENPDVCVLDIGLPEFDGHELARRLRALPGMADVPLVAVSGYGQARDRERALAAGFDRHFVKPVMAADSFSACRRRVSASAVGIKRPISLAMITGIIWKVEALPTPVAKNSSRNAAKKPRNAPG